MAGRAEQVTQNPVVDDPIKVAMDAIIAGKDPAAEVYGSNVKGFERGPSDNDESESEERPNPLDTIEETGTDESDDTPTASSFPKAERTSLDNVKESSKTSNNKNIEELFVKGPEGKRQAIKIDYSNKEDIKQAYLKAAGMQKFRHERDVVQKNFQKVETEYKSIKADIDKLEDIFKNQGAKGVVLALGGENKLKELVDAEIRHREYLGSLTPNEKYQLEAKQHQELADKRTKEVQDKYERMLSDLQAKEEQATTRSLESRLHPSFDRYRFAGRLGDEVAEHRLDKTIWSEVTERLAQYPDDVELTQGIIDREFRTVAQELQKVINVQAEKKVVKTVDKKKAEATRAAQITARKGLSTSGDKERFVDSIKSGDILSALGLMNNGKVKL